MHAALDINMPNYASAIVSTEEIVAAIAAPLYSMKNSCWLYFVSLIRLVHFDVIMRKLIFEK